jgi:subtilisin family serine protease
MSAIRRLVDEFGCRIVNLSLGGDGFSDIEQTFYAGLADEGVLIVAAAGNESADHVSYPAGYAGVLAVGAVDNKNQHASFSNTGEDLDLSAPGVAVLSSVPRDTGEESSVKTNKVYAANGMTFAGHTDGVAALLVDCGTGNSPGEFPAKVAGNVALIKRGDQTFAVKVENAMNAGALAAIVYNNVAGDFAGTLGTAQTSDQRDWIPVLSVSDTTGALLRKWLNKKSTVVNALSSWARFDGTSMASPMVAGIAGLLLSANPSLTAADLTEILQQTATRLGGRGYNTTYGWGLVNADAAVKAAQRR